MIGCQNITLTLLHKNHLPKCGATHFQVTGQRLLKAHYCVNCPTYVSKEIKTRIIYRLKLWKYYKNKWIDFYFYGRLVSRHDAIPSIMIIPLFTWSLPLKVRSVCLKIS